jgi:hypothetical protein
MEISVFPKYPVHDEPRPSQRERLFEADREAPWLSAVFVLIPVIVTFAAFVIWLFTNGVGVPI